MKLTMILALAFTLGGCAFLQSAQNSPEYKQFCSWAPVASAGIEQAIVQSAKDPAKAKVTSAMTQALMYLRVAASQCPPEAVTP